MRIAKTLGLGLVLIACGGSDDSSTAPPPPSDPYTTQPNTTVVVGPKTAPGNGTVVTTPTGDQSVTLPSGACVKPQDKCKNDRADVIVDSTGKVVEIVCYPAVATPTPTDSQGNIELGRTNQGVIVIDGNNDGVDVAGNVKAEGNGVTLYGAGSDVSVIGGNVDAHGNNFAARGVTVKGNVTIDGNNATMVLCVVEGDLIIKGNNAVVAQCTVLGKIVVEGENAVLVGNKVSQGIDPGRRNTTCDGNVDAAGVAINCSDEKKPK